MQLLVPSSTSFVSASAGDFTIGASGVLSISITGTGVVDFQVGFSYSGSNSLALGPDSTLVGSAFNRQTLTRIFTGLTPGAISLTISAARRAGTGSTNIYAAIDCYSP